jgi:hypothetical protein
MERSDRLRGRMHLQIFDPLGRLMTERRSGNIVVKKGAEIVARLLGGGAEGKPIDRVQVGFGRETIGVEATALTPPQGGSVPAEALRSPVPPESFKVRADKPGVLQLLITTVFKPTVELKDVSEAGLMAGDALYNQVVFEPVTLRVGQDITFFWEVDLPYGH